MVHTELKFVRLMEELDDYRDEISDLAGEINSIVDEGNEDEMSDYIHDLEEDIESLYLKTLKIAKELGVSEEVIDTHFDSCITNRWEIYAHIQGAEIVSLVDIANGRA